MIKDWRNHRICIMWFNRPTSYCCWSVSLFPSGTDDEYEVGDLSGKYGTFLNLSAVSKTIVDYNLPMFGRNSIQGRSLVIHKLKIQDNNMRWVCNNLSPVVDKGTTYFMKAIANISGPSVEGMVVLASSDSTSINRISSITVLQILDRSKRGDCCTFSHTFFWLWSILFLFLGSVLFQLTRCGWGRINNLH